MTTTGLRCTGRACFLPYAGHAETRSAAYPSVWTRMDSGVARVRVASEVLEPFDEAIHGPLRKPCFCLPVNLQSMECSNRIVCV